MKELSIEKHIKQKTKVCIALGYFDCVHIGHRAIIQKTIQLAKQKKGKTVVMSFKDDYFSQVVKGSKPLYSYRDRIELLDSLSIDYVLPFVFDDDFMQTKPQDFLQMLFDKFNVVALVCGYDFRYGHKGKGDVELLDKFCVQNGATLELVSSELYQGKRVSTTGIKQTLLDLDFERANAMLGQDYFVSGTVVKGREQGNKNGQPTANININRELFKVPDGVYGTRVEVDKRLFKAVTNVGGKPTYDIKEQNIESLLIGFDGDMYDKHIKIYFYKKLRDIKKFGSVDQLIIQIEKDKNWN